MAWFSHGDDDNASMVRALKNNGIISEAHPEVEFAMEAVDRAHFVNDKRWAYVDSPSPIGHNATISAPHMHAYALGLLHEQLTRSGAKALDVGSGSGYLTACMAKLVSKDGRGGKVVGIEHIPELVERSKTNIANDKSLQELVDRGTLKLITGDGRAGYPSEAPYDAIHVGAAAAEIPSALIEQLKPGGRMVIPCGPEDGMQYLMVINKSANGEISSSEQMAVRYVPLTNKDDQLQGSRF